MPYKTMPGFERWDFYNPIENRLKTVDASDTPFITWPNHVPCFEANMYMRLQLQASRSRLIKGGTLTTYASQIIHLVNYCYNNQILFSELTDDRFTHFIRGLQGERDQMGELKRKNNTVRKIGKRCLEFLVSIQDIHDLTNFIGPGRENKIQIKLKRYKKKKSNGSKSDSEFNTEILHHSLPTKDAITRKKPVSEADILKVWEYINTQQNHEKVLRDRVVYQLLEQTGARRTELHLLTVKDVKDAIRSSTEAPYLKIKTLKKRSNEPKERSFPVTHELLTVLNQYIKRVRKKVIKRKLLAKEKKDHGFLLVSLTTGEPLQSDTTTSYMREWALAARVTGEVTPHLYRHAFITNKLKELIREHDINNEDEFRKKLLNTTAFKIQLQQWTGHTALTSLDTYINLAFSELSGFNQTLSIVKLNDAVKLMEQSIELIKQDISNRNITLTEALHLFTESLDAFKRDISLAEQVVEND